MTEEEKRKRRGDLIMGYKRAIELIEVGINNVAKAHIPDFHFLNHKVSTFWRCEKSPIGMCVFNLIGTRSSECRYCHQPEERK